ncbi:MAG: DNA topoisomerase I [Candidatus Bathyarchaeia archaeon]
MIITEKPDAANRIATALDAQGKPKKSFSSGVPYFQAYRNGDIVVVPALGHLYTITNKQKNEKYPIFDYQWVPKYQIKNGNPRIRVWLKVISELAHDASEFVNGCDFDIEGSVIGYTILKYACGEKQLQAKRMKYSTLTEEDLQEAYSQLLPKLDFDAVQAGLTRHEVDWLYGINLSRALTQAVKKSSGHYATLSTGRVQGPTLRFLEKREKEIRCFVPTPYWNLTAKISINGTLISVTYGKNLETLTEATTLKKSCKTKVAKIEGIITSNTVVNPPVPFDLGTLQIEAYKLFHFTPMHTSNILQRLYLEALISYPRTNSQKLPPSISYRGILKKIGKTPLYSTFTNELLNKTNLRPNEGKKDDPAHPAIYPTGNLPKKPLDTQAKNLLDFIIKRFLAVFGEPALRQNIKATISLNNYCFYFNAARTINEGWFHLYHPYVQIKDDTLPTLIEGQILEVKRITLKKHFTLPPQRYNPRSLLQKMEKEEIGTKATRASIIETLKERKYLIGTDRLSVSDLGFEVIDVLEKYCPTVVSPDMTRSLESKMDAIQCSQETKNSVISDAIERLKVITAQLKNEEGSIGEQLSFALQQSRLESNTIGTCPNCKGALIIITSKKTKKRFVGCINYFQNKCSTTYPLPQLGIIKPLARICSCGTTMVSVYLKKRAPWRLCLNPQCPTKEK